MPAASAAYVCIEALSCDLRRHQLGPPQRSSTFPMPSKQGPRTWARCTNLEHPHFSLPQLLAAHPINHIVQLITPGPNPTDDMPIIDFNNDSCLALGRLGDIVHELVVGNAWPHREGASGAVAVAVGPQLNSTGGIAITDSGMLHMAVTTSTYQQLGLLGKRSKTQPGQWYLVEVDLTSKGCRPGQPYHNRVVDRLNEAVGQCCLAVATGGHDSKSTTTATAKASGIVSGLGQAAMDHIQHGDAVEQASGMETLTSLAAGAVAPTDPPSTLRTTMLPAGATGPQAAGDPAMLLQGLPPGSIRPLAVRRRSWQVTGVALPTLTRSTVMGSQTGSASSRPGHVAPGPHMQQDIPEQGDMQVDEAEGLHESQEPLISHAVAMPTDDVGGGDFLMLDSTSDHGQPAHASGLHAAPVRAVTGQACVQELHQWLGAINCGFPGAAVNALLPAQLACAPSAPTTMHNEQGCISVHEWSGLLHNHMVQQVVLHASQSVRSGSCAWAAVCVWGWEDSPVAWQGMERSAAHTLGLPGDSTSHYCLVILPHNDMLIMRALGAAEVSQPCTPKPAHTPKPTH